MSEESEYEGDVPVGKSKNTHVSGKDGESETCTTRYPDTDLMRYLNKQEARLYSR